VPAAIDQAVRNVPPSYPPEAVAEGEEGAVILLVHVAPSGAASAVDVALSSGYVLLDDAARAAVASWRFLPAHRGRTPVASSIPIRIRFVLTNSESRPNPGSSK
jgi:protein TonB